MRRRALVSGAALVAVLLIGSCSTGDPAGPTDRDPPIVTSTGVTSTSGAVPRSNAAVTRVVNSDTVEVDFGAERSPFV